MCEGEQGSIFREILEHHFPTSGLNNLSGKMLVQLCCDGKAVMLQKRACEGSKTLSLSELTFAMAMYLMYDVLQTLFVH